MVFRKFGVYLLAGQAAGLEELRSWYRLAVQYGCLKERLTITGSA